MASALVVLLLAAPALGAERWGWFGIRIRDLSEREAEDLSIKLGLGEGYGVVVSEILPDAPATSSGLRAGDLIVTIDGRPVTETRVLQRLVGSTAPGRELRVVVLREGRRRELGVRVGQMPPDAVAERIAAEFGFLVRTPLGDDTGRGRERPVPVVAAVGERSPADRGGLHVGDRILAVNGVEVATLDEFRREVGAMSLRAELRLRVEREGEPLSLVLPPAQAPPQPAN
jgi:serine protease Do